MGNLANNTIFNIDNLKRLMEGLAVTLNIALVSVILSTILGILFDI